MTDTDRGAEAFETLYESQYQRLVRLGALLLTDVEAGEDIAQEAFARFLEHRSVANPGAYLTATVVNLARGRHRRSVVMRRHRPDVAAPSPGADTHVDRVGLRTQVLAALRRLPPRQREAVALRYYQDLTDTAVATAMGISVGSVKTHLHRANTALAHDLEGFR